MGLCELTEGQKGSKRMIISTHRLEERPTCQVWMAAGPDWHKPGGDSGCPGSKPQLPLPLTAWAVLSSRLHLPRAFPALVLILVFDTYKNSGVVSQAGPWNPQEIFLWSTIADAGGFPTIKWNTLGLDMLWCCLEVSCSRKSSIWDKNHSSKSILILALPLLSIHQL